MDPEEENELAPTEVLNEESIPAPASPEVAESAQASEEIGGALSTDGGTLENSAAVVTNTGLVGDVWGSALTLTRARGTGCHHTYNHVYLWLCNSVI